MTTPASHDAPASLWLGPHDPWRHWCRSGRSAGAGRRPCRLSRRRPSLGRYRRSRLCSGMASTQRFVLSMLTLAGAVGLFALRSRLWRLRWPAALHAERLYSFTVAALDAVGRRVAPALQSASLRSYVLTVVATAIALVTLALAADGALPPPRRWTPVAIHEGLLAALIVAGALTAAFARLADGRSLIAGHGWLWSGGALCPPRRTGPRDDPVRGRDADRRHLRTRRSTSCAGSAISRLG